MATKPNTSLFDQLAKSGAEILTDAKSLDYYAHDIYSRGADLTAVVRPHDKEELAAAVGIATSNGLAVIPRGGGMSYTGGLTSDVAGAVLFDLAYMNRVLEINETDMLVKVEPGCTWEALYTALKPLGLRTPFWGTLSGLKATVGGGMSQNSIFWGTGRYGTAAENCVSLEVVLADGSLIQTGSDFAARYGPDLTGLFLADTGAMGMKASITLPLIPEAKSHAYASFVFESHADVLSALGDIERAGLAAECFGFDPKLNAIRMKRDSMASDAKALVGMMKAQGSVFKAIKEGAKVVTAGRDFLKDAKFSLHVLAEGRMQAAADADIEAARELVEANNGTETENTIPKIIRANPFGPLNMVLSGDGERWAPIHGVLPHSKAVSCYQATLDLFDKYADDMVKHGVTTGTLIAAIGGTGVAIEPCLYWPDESNPLIDETIEPAHLAKLPKFEANAENWAFVQKLKQELVDLFHEFGAMHMQIGRTYRYWDSLDPAAQRMIRSIKTMVDPDNKMNPGSLGIS